MENLKNILWLCLAGLLLAALPAAAGQIVVHPFLRIGT